MLKNKVNNKKNLYLERKKKEKMREKTTLTMKSIDRFIISLQFKLNKRNRNRM